MPQPVTGKLIVLYALGLLLPANVPAFDMGNMMNPSEWFGNNRDDYNNGYYGPPGPAYGYSYADAGGYAVPGYAAPGYAAPGAAVPGYANQGYAAPGYTTPGYPAPATATPNYGPGGYPAPGTMAPGYGAPGYAIPGAPAAGAYAPAPAVSAPAYSPPATGDSGEAAEIARLKQRIRELEELNASLQNRPAQAPAGASPATPVWGGFEPPESAPASSTIPPEASPSAAASRPHYPPIENPGSYPAAQPASGATLTQSQVPVPPPVIKEYTPDTGYGQDPYPTYGAAGSGWGTGTSGSSTAGQRQSTVYPQSQSPGPTIYDFGR